MLDLLMDCVETYMRPKVVVMFLWFCHGRKSVWMKVLRHDVDGMLHLRIERRVPKWELRDLLY